MHPAHVMAMTMIRDVLKTTGITATVGIGTNLFLANVAMDTARNPVANCRIFLVVSFSSLRLMVS